MRSGRAAAAGDRPRSIQLFVRSNRSLTQAPNFIGFPCIEHTVCSHRAYLLTACLLTSLNCRLSPRMQVVPKLATGASSLDAMSLDAMSPALRWRGSTGRSIGIVP